jgi:peptidoglycan lytic transglycosylase
MNQSAEGGVQRAVFQGSCALRSALCALIAFIVYGCATTAPMAPPPAENLHGVASWYGEEFAGRTTANGEIFDPLLLTAAHRTLPFGTVLDITNPKTTKTVRVRVNDRGPYIGGRVIDLSYAAAQQIGLIEPGIGEVDIKIVHIGSGEREPPMPMEVTIAEAPKTVSAIASSEPPKVDFPLPPKSVTPEPVVVDKITVEEQHGGMITRKQVAPNGTTITDVPVKAADAAPPAASFDEQVMRTAPSAPAPKHGQFVVQVGAFSVEANAKQLQERLTTIGQQAWIDRQNLYRVRIGPFATRDLAMQTRTALEANGISAIIVAE